jgi:hypothetical protein
MIARTKEIAPSGKANSLPDGALLSYIGSLVGVFVRSDIRASALRTRIAIEVDGRRWT